MDRQDLEKKIKELEGRVTWLKYRLSKEQKRARTGHLTGLPNRRGMEFEAKRALAQADRSGTPLSVLFIDLDLFKAINDTYGHRVGDAVLKEFARFLKEVVRTSDIVARPGGDEFVVLLPATDLRGAQYVARKICQVLCGKRFTRKRLSVSISIGVASTSEGCSTFSCLKEKADERMYKTKQRKKGR